MNNGNTEKPISTARIKAAAASAMAAALAAAVLAVGLLVIRHWNHGDQRPSAPATIRVALDQVTHGWTDPGALMFTSSDGKAHLPRHGLSVTPEQTSTNTLEIIARPDGGHRTVLHSPRQYPFIAADENEESADHPEGRAEGAEPVDLAVPDCGAYQAAPLMPLADCAEEEKYWRGHDKDRLPRYAITRQIRNTMHGDEGWVSPSVFAAGPGGCLLLDVRAALSKKPTSEADVKITATGEGQGAWGWRADGPVPASAELPPPSPGREHSYDPAITAAGHAQCPAN